MSKFNDVQVNGMVTRYNDGTSLRKIADEFGCSVPTVRRILASQNVTIRKRGRPVRSTETEQTTELPSFQATGNW